MPKRTRVQKLLWLYRHDVITVHRAVDQFIDLAAEADPSEFVPQLPADLLDGVRLRVAEAPTTEEGWDNMCFIVTGTFASADPGWEERYRSIYRAGVESLRSYFDREASGA